MHGEVACSLTGPPDMARCRALWCSLYRTVPCECEFEGTMVIAEAARWSEQVEACCVGSKHAPSEDGGGRSYLPTRSLTACCLHETRRTESCKQSSSLSVTSREKDLSHHAGRRRDSYASERKSW